MKDGIMNSGAPVMCILPEYDIARMTALTGEPQVTNLVSEADARSVGRLCAAFLRSLPHSERREALRCASAWSAGPQVDMVPLAALLPGDASVDQLTELLNGLILMLLSLGSASADTSVGTVVANAMAMASGKPFASDPMVGERQNEVLLAKAILEAALLGDEEAQAWFKDNKLADALAAIAEGAKGGKSDASDEYTNAVTAMQHLYDCAAHQGPLGGDPEAGSALTDFISEAAGALKKGAAAALKDLGSSLSKSKSGEGTRSDNGGASALAAARDKVGRAQTQLSHATAVREGAIGLAKGLESHEIEEGSQKKSDLSAAASAKDRMDEGVAAARNALQEARASLQSGNEDLSSYRNQLRAAALQSAKLQWAQAILDAPEDVAEILSAAAPNMSDPGTFLQSMLATLPAAKQTGNLGTIKALVYAIRSAAAKGDGSADSLYSLIAGDPAVQVGASANDDAYTARLNNSLVEQKRAIARARKE